MEDRRFIEETFPVKEVGKESAKEKSIRYGHISTLHIWWARRPLASSRAVNFASLIPPPKSQEELQRKKDFIVKLSKWESSVDRTILEKAKKEILDANGNTPPKILDPYAGGGSIPLEALRLGCETYASDYNPVASLILKCTLEYPQKYGVSTANTPHGLVSDTKKNRLSEDVKKWGNWVLKEAEKDIGRFYPEEEDGSIPVGYIWARTIPCQNPACNAEIPLMRQFWLCNREEKRVSLYPYVLGKEIKFRIVGTGYEKFPPKFDPSGGTVSRAVARCLVCGSMVDDKSTRSLFTDMKSGQKLVAVVFHDPLNGGKRYRVAVDGDVRAFNNAEAYLSVKRNRLTNEWGMDPIPDEDAPGTVGSNALGFRYNFVVFGDYFNARQKLALITFVEKVRHAYEQMLEQGYDAEYAKAVTTYLAFAVDRQVDYNSSLCAWAAGEFIAHTFGRQAIPMVWDYFELSPSSKATGDWDSAMNWILRVLEHLTSASGPLATVSQLSATSLPYPGNFFDAVFTDPPYYDNVCYAMLSDFFYVWLKRTIGHLYPDLFSTVLTPRTEEIIADKYRWKSEEKAKLYFEDMLRRSFKQIYRVLKPNGVVVIIFAHKSTAGWETLTNSLLDSGLVVTGAWPIHTERPGGMRVVEKASLASSIYMVARKVERDSVGFYKEVRDSLRKHVDRKLDALWNEGISGADFFIAGIGSSIEVFGRYDKILDDEGNTVRAEKLLEDVRRIVTDYAVKQVLHDGIAGEITTLTRFYVLWRWGYGDAKLEFDDALKLAHGVGIDITQEWNKGFIKKDKEFVRILGPDDRDADELNGSLELIDVLHSVLLLWRKGKNEEVVRILKETGFGKSDAFYRVAQAISESLPNGNREKKLLEGFVQGRERISEDVRKEVVQRRLFE